MMDTKALWRDLNDGEKVTFEHFGIQVSMMRGDVHNPDNMVEVEWQAGNLLVIITHDRMPDDEGSILRLCDFEGLLENLGSIIGTSSWFDKVA